MEYALNLPINIEDIRKLKAGDRVLLSGPMLTARDAAHKRMMEALEKGEALPFSIEGETVYYMGPSPARLRGTDDERPHGRLYAGAPHARNERNDREGQKE